MILVSDVYNPTYNPLGCIPCKLSTEGIPQNMWCTKTYICTASTQTNSKKSHFSVSKSNYSIIYICQNFFLLVSLLDTERRALWTPKIFGPKHTECTLGSDQQHLNQTNGISFLKELVNNSLEYCLSILFQEQEFYLSTSRCIFLCCKGKA